MFNISISDSTPVTNFRISCVGRPDFTIPKKLDWSITTITFLKPSWDLRIELRSWFQSYFSSPLGAETRDLISDLRPIFIITLKLESSGFPKSWDPVWYPQPTTFFLFYFDSEFDDNNGYISLNHWRRLWRCVRTVSTLSNDPMMANTIHIGTHHGLWVTPLSSKRCIHISCCALVRSLFISGCALDRSFRSNICTTIVNMTLRC